MNSICLVVIFYIVQHCHCNTQNYNIFQERLDILYSNEKYLKLEGNVDQIKNSQNMTLTIFKDLPNTIEYSAAMHQLANRGYGGSEFPVHGRICGKMNREYKYMIYQHVHKFGRFLPPRCPIKQGVYWYRNFVINEDLCPEDLPEWKFRADFNVTLKEELLASLRIFMRIERKRV